MVVVRDIFVRGSLKLTIAFFSVKKIKRDLSNIIKAKKYFKIYFLL